MFKRTGLAGAAPGAGAARPADARGRIERLPGGRFPGAAVNLGAHMSIAGGVYRALERGREAGCSVVQVFTRNQTRWDAPPLHPQAIERFLRLRPSFYAVFAHSSYLINLASPDRRLYRRSVLGLAEELRRCRALRLEMLVLHPGFHLGAGVQAGLRRAARGLEEAFRRAEETTPGGSRPPAAEKWISAGSGPRPVRILLEGTSGQGSALGGRLEELRGLLDRLDERGVPAGICLDTCHLHAAGYPLGEPAGFGETLDRLEKTIGLRRVGAFHLNDSRGELGSRLDRHEHIGCGRIGLEGFRLLLGDPRLRTIPMCLETPKGKGLEEDIRNLAILRSLRGPSSGPYGSRTRVAGMKKRPAGSLSSGADRLLHAPS